MLLIWVLAPYTCLCLCLCIIKSSLNFLLKIEKLLNFLPVVLNAKQITSMVSPHHTTPFMHQCTLITKGNLNLGPSVTVRVFLLQRSWLSLDNECSSPCYELKPCQSCNLKAFPSWGLIFLGH
ncbi:hypothetical protein O6H91_02G122500 [Diphasiastrum complanatum]|uniref:Uncharacterized protein n=1 Tax=Diphasiastrum complanatum TaxID=34168 RepID=A0ACC2EKG4_DIPCM|nr:hypothetical protein O6H91_02G122500 [Diphasiastrum complanatum]